MNLGITKQFRLFLDPYYWRSAILIAYCGVARQYRNSYLGALWLLLPAIAMMVIYSIIMPMIMKSDAKSYVPYLLSTLPLRCIMSSSVFPVADVLKNAYSYFVGFIGMAIFALLFGFDLSWHIFLLPIYLIPVMLTVMCMCVGIAYIAPYIQDIRDAITIAMNVLIWGSAVIYPITAVSEKAQAIIHWNPLYILLEPAINLVHDHQIPSLFVTAKLFGVMFLALSFGYTLYRIGRKNFVYYL